MSTKLKPCPFCGGEPEVASVRAYVYIYCHQCGASTRELEGKQKVKKVSELWNMRKPSKGEIRSAL